jgi:hypothetical protein
MKMTTLASCVAIIGVAWVVSRETRDTTLISPPEVGELAVGEPRVADKDPHSVALKDERGSAAGAASRVAMTLATVPGEDELSARWDGLAPNERTRELRTRIEIAIAAMRKGENRQVHAAVADTALTALRAELYSTAEGREQHQRLEEQVDVFRRREP